MTPLQSLRANIAAKGHHIHARRASQSSRSSLDTLFDHTSGRWLWNEAEQLKVRHRRFDIPGLQQVACQAIGTKRCLSLKKIGEGNFNKAYRLEMEDGQVVIAKIPQPNAGPSTLTTSSEVATMEFARDILNIPVPKVLAWSATDQNPVQAEYIIMEEARGSQLHEVWKDLPLRKKVNIIHEFVEIERKLLSVSFDKYGPACSIAYVASSFWLTIVLGSGRCTSEIVGFRDVSLLSSKLLQMVLPITLLLIIASDPSRDESSGKNSAVRCNIMVPVSVPIECKARDVR